MNSPLLNPIQIRDLKIRNRIFMSPMCQYSATEGVAGDWHMAHLGARATGGVGLVVVEATGISPEGRISLGCLGLWNEKQAQALIPIVQFVKSQGAAICIQLAHAGRKASHNLAWLGGQALTSENGGWPCLAPSPIPFSERTPKPQEMSRQDIQQNLKNWVQSTELARRVGFDCIEIHMAHGYLLNEFLSPLANKRADEFGGSLENRMRYPLMVAKAIRESWPQNLPVFTRISATDWVEGGWTIEDSIVLCSELKKLGIDLIDCSSGGNSLAAQIPFGPNYQVSFAEKIKRQSQILTGAVGLITTQEQAEEILLSQKADVIFLGRELLRNPYWALQIQADKENKPIPKQYLRGF